MKSKKACPECGSSDLSLFLGGDTGQYQCLKCGYIGAFVIESDENQKRK